MARSSPRRTAAAAGAILVAILAPCASLQLNASPERPVALYRAPSPYKEPGRPALSSLIVTSRPVHVNKADQEGGASEADVRRGSPAQWRRQLFVSTSLGTGELLSVTVTAPSTVRINEKSLREGEGEGVIRRWMLFTRNLLQY